MSSVHNKGRVNDLSDSDLTQELVEEDHELTGQHVGLISHPPSSVKRRQCFWDMLSQSKTALVTVLLVLFIMCAVVRLTCFSLDAKNKIISSNSNSTQVSATKLTRNFSPSSYLHVPGMKRRLPKCIIIGVRKCGTRALLEFLNLHPQIRIAEQEVHFFDTIENYKNGLDWYRKKMPYSYVDQITIEKSPAYFITQHVPTRISHMNKGVKILVIVREPTTRVISDYTQIHANHLARNRTHQSFEDTVVNWSTGRINLKFKPVRTSIYQHHMARWLKIFPKEQIHVVNGDDLVQNPMNELRSVEKFLGLEHRILPQQLFFNKTRGFYCMINGAHEHCLGLSKGRKHPRVNPNVRQRLDNFFHPHNKKFFNQIGRSFDWP